MGSRSDRAGRNGRAHGSVPHLGPALLDLATARTGPAVRLAAMLRRPDAYPEDLRRFADFVGPHAGPDFDEQARSLVNVIRDRIAEIAGSDDLRAAVLLHVLRLDEHTAGGTTMQRRLERAVELGLVPRRKFETLRGYWKSGRPELAKLLEDRLTELRGDADGWSAYREVPAPPYPHPVSSAQPIVVTKQVGTYWITDRQTDCAWTERWIRALEPIAAYTVTAWSPDVRERESFEIRSGLNCRSGAAEVIDHDAGGHTIEVPMIFPRPLEVDETHFFSSEVAGQRNLVPIIEVQVSGQGIDELTLRVQFEADDLPAEVWWFAECLDDERLRPPREDEGRRLPCSAFGFLEHRFVQCRPRQKYGLAWRFAKRAESDGAATKDWRHPDG